MVPEVSRKKALVHGRLRWIVVNLQNSLEKDLKLQRFSKLKENSQKLLDEYLKQEYSGTWLIRTPRGHAIVSILSGVRI